MTVKIPPPAPTSMPSSTTRSSSSMAVRHAGGERVHVPRGGHRGLSRRRHAANASSICRDGGVAWRAGPRRRRGRPHPSGPRRARRPCDGVRQEPVAADAQRVALPPGGDLVLGLVGLGVALVVSVPAVGLGLEQDGSAAVAARGGGLLGGRVDRVGVVAVDGVGLDPVRGGAVGDAGHTRHPAAVAELGVDVVLADEDDGQVPDRGEVHGLVEGALVDRAFAEEGDGDAFLAQQLAREARADREREAGADDRVRADDPVGGVRHVHRAALAAAEAIGAGEELGHHPVDVDALRQAVAVATVGGRQVVAVAQCDTDACGDPLLAQGGVDEAGDVTVPIELGDPGLEGADQGHDREQLAAQLGTGWGFRRGTHSGHIVDSNVCVSDIVRRTRRV